ncbi:MAG: hypothetical protein GY827_04810 [Cytophagales bacterium]|nr:hypothetical protein [Cytophagales bacterium]
MNNLKPVGVRFKMSFGKYKDSTIGKILSKDPDYILWLIDNNILKQGFKKEVFEAAYVGSLESKESDLDISTDFPEYT